MIGYTTVTQKGQITIPVDIRTALGLSQGKKVLITLEAGSAKVKAVPDFFQFKGSVKSKTAFEIKSMRENAKEHVVKRHLTK